MVSALRQGKVSAHNQIGTHELVSDANSAEGGEDAGPSPHHLLEAALASCTVITLQMYANRKGWPLKSANVEVNITSESSAATNIERRISLQGDLTAEQRKRLLQISDKCPIHKILKSQITIITSIT